MARYDKEDWIADQLETAYTEALLQGWPTIESSRREGKRYVSFDEPVDDAIYWAVSNSLEDDGFRALVIGALKEATKKDAGLRTAFAREMAKQNAIGVLCVKDDEFAEDLYRQEFLDNCRFRDAIGGLQ